MKILVSNFGAISDHATQRLQQASGFDTESVDCPAALPQVRRQCPDVVVMDVDGNNAQALGTVRDIRAFHAELPIVVIGDSQNPSTATDFLTAGADDYIRKPADYEELIARIAAVSRRATRPTFFGGITDTGPVVIDDRCKRVTVFGVEVALSPKEYQLLQLCASEPGKVFSHEEITACLWPERGDGDVVDIKQYVHLLRSKLGRVRGGRDLIENVKGFGYRLALRATNDESASADEEDRPRAVGEN